MKRLSAPLVPPLARLFGPPKDALFTLVGCNPGRMASSIAYYGAFSLAPMLVIAISIASMIFGKDASEGLVVDQLSVALGEDTARFIQSMLATFYTSGALTLATVLAGLLLLWAATRIVGSLRGALNDIWGVTGRGKGRVQNYVFGKLIDVGIVLAAAGIFLASMAASTALSNLSDRLSRTLTVPGWLFQLLVILLALAMAALFLSLIFRVLPNIRVRFTYILGGASLTAVFFVLGNYLIGRYLGRTAPGSGFGAAGSLIVIMLWLNYTAYIILFGAALTRVYAERGEARRQARRAAGGSSASPATQPARDAPSSQDRIPGELKRPRDLPSIRLHLRPRARFRG